VDPLTHRRLGISDSLLDAVKGITEKKKLDPVGKADADIDNDGDVDKSDEYLKNRRKAIKKSMKKDDKKPSGKKDQVDLEPQLDDKMNESATAKKVAEGIEDRHADAYERVIKHLDKVKAPEHKAKFQKKLDTHLKSFDYHYEKDTGQEHHAVDDMHDLANDIKKHNSKVSESYELKEESIKIYYRNPKDGKTHTMNVFTAQDARQAEMDLKRQGMNIIKKEMGEEKSPDGVDKGAVDKHNCATHVYHEQWGEGQTIRTMHADPDEHGFVDWYDVMFEHGIEKGVPVAEMKVTKEMSHGNHKKKK
jgi:hypothetical protein